jgi:hypothetical protein
VTYIQVGHIGGSYVLVTYLQVGHIGGSYVRVTYIGVTICKGAPTFVRVVYDR